MTRAAFYAPIVLSLVAVVAACAGRFASHADQPETAVEPAAETVPMIVGGYGPGDVSEAGAQVAYQMAVDAIAAAYPSRALVDEVSLETQLVAGMNYRFRIEMTGAPDARDIYSVTVYRNLQDAYDVTDLSKLQ